MRNNSLDSIAGILIIYMIFGHCCQNAGYTNSFLYSNLQDIFFFFMAWFFFKAGMYHKPVESAYGILVKQSKRLLLPFIVFSLIGHSVSCLFYIFKGDSNIIHYTLSPVKQIVLFGAPSWNLPLWFLLSLFYTKILLLCANNKYMPIMVIMGGAIACVLSRIDFLLPFALSSLPLAISFYGVGYLFRNLQYNKRMLWICIAVCLLCCFYPSMVDFRTNSLVNGSFIVWMCDSVAAIVIINNVFKCFVPEKIFNSIGRESMIYYVLHWIVIMIVKETFLLSNIDISSGLLTLIMLVLSVIIPYVVLILVPKSALIKIGL